MSINQVPETTSHYVDPKAVMLTGISRQHPHSAKPKSIHEHVCYRQQSTLLNVLFIKDGVLEPGSVRVPLTYMKEFWNLSNAAAFIILIIVLNWENDQREGLRVSIPTVPCCCAEMITAPRNALPNMLHIGTRDCRSGERHSRS